MNVSEYAESTSNVIDICAVDSCGWNWPTHWRSKTHIDYGASSVTGIEYDHDMDKMTVHRPKMQLLSISSALKASINLICNIGNLATPNSLYHVE